MGYFGEDGHIAAGGFAALLAGEAGELERLELAEHMDFCGECLARYMRALEGAELLSPPRPLRVGARAPRRGAGRLIRLCTAAAAAGLAVVMWLQGGALMDAAGLRGQPAQEGAAARDTAPPARTGPAAEDGNSKESGVDWVIGGLFSFVNGGQGSAAVSLERRQSAERERREQVFERRAVPGE